MAPDLSQFQKYNGRPTSADCRMASLISQLRERDVEAAAALQAALETDRAVIQHTAIKAWLKHEHGLEVSDSTIGKHRRAGCPCFEAEEAA